MIFVNLAREQAISKQALLTCRMGEILCQPSLRRTQRIVCQPARRKPAAMLIRLGLEPPRPIARLDADERDPMMSHRMPNSNKLPSRLDLDSQLIMAKTGCAPADLLLAVDRGSWKPPR